VGKEGVFFVYQGWPHQKHAIQKDGTGKHTFQTTQPQIKQKMTRNMVMRKDTGTTQRSKTVFVGRFEIEIYTGVADGRDSATTQQPKRSQSK